VSPNPSLNWIQVWLIVGGFVLVFACVSVTVAKTWHAVRALVHKIIHRKKFELWTRL
jgi:hypothetical protein